MPASEFAWAGEARLPIFQMYGTKRKAPQENGQHWTPNTLQQNEPNGAKRACLWGSGNAQDDTSMCTDMAMENNNTLILHPQQQQQQHPLSHQNTTAWPSPHLEPQSHQPALQPTQHIQQQGGVMDLCGETFTTSTIAETDEALMTMDSDFTPNPEQYRSAQTTQQSSAGMSVPDMRSDFCNDYCGVGERSPTSSCVRCYCKPSWEGMMTMRPYISDIY